MKIALRIFALVLLLAAPRLALAETPIDEAGDYAISATGRRFRVRFDPASHLRLGLAGAAHGSEGTAEVIAGIDYRDINVSGKGRDRVIWQLDHRIIDGWVSPMVGPGRSLPALDATLYGISALRHDESPFLVVPASPPIGIPFPFDVGLESEIGRVIVPAVMPEPARAGGAPVSVVHVGVMRASLVLDPWRSGRPGKSFEIGIGGRYDLDAIGVPSLGTTHVIHRVAPMTAGSLRLRLQDRDGLYAFDCRGDIVPQWTSEGSGWKVSAFSSAKIERTMLALNDQPIVATLEGGYRFNPATTETAASNEVRVSLGLSFNLTLR